MILPRQLMGAAGVLGGLLLLSLGQAAEGAGEVCLPLAGAWRFTLDRVDAGAKEGWYQQHFDRASWRTVTVPHTWQVEPGTEDYHGVAWYAREVIGSVADRGKYLQLEFDAVNRDATVWLNGTRLGEHTGSGYTAFALRADPWHVEGTNLVVVRVDNRFSTNAFPYERSFDWPSDGGIIRGVRLRGLPVTHLGEPRVHVEVDEDLRQASLTVPLEIIGAAPADRGLRIVGVVTDPAGRVLHESWVAAGEDTKSGFQPIWSAKIQDPVLWHFDSPSLHGLRLRLEQDGQVLHEREVTFGIRRVEVRPGRFVLNGEPMRLMGVEWMPGSDPRYGLAEDPRIAREILEDMKRLNCVFTRFHWQQDPAVFDFCDTEGMLVQEEVPVWGKHPVTGPALESLHDRHLAEMIRPHFNHPSIFAWGLGNEIKGGSEAGRAFVRRGLKQARSLDPTRLVSYASNTLQPNPGPDAGGLMDFIEWNEYYGSWYGGGVSNIPGMLDKIQAAFPTKGVVISEYGLCECDPKHPEGDDVRIEWMRTHTDAYRAHPAVAGAIYFDYNDYRTHMGDKGQGSFQQRVHGVVNLLRHRKPSWEALRRECSPVRTFEVLPPAPGGTNTEVRLRLVTRALENDFPAYTLRDYELVWTATDEKGLPVAAGKVTLPELPPGTEHLHTLAGVTVPARGRVHAEIFRPTGYSVLDTVWRRED